MTKLVWIAILAGLALGIVGTLVVQAIRDSADIAVDCSSSASDYSCTFFNKGPGSAAQCVVVTLTRSKPTDDYVKPSSFKQITGHRLCSGVLAKGQDRTVKGSGFFTPEGTGVTGMELCQIKSTPSYVAGCEVDSKVVLRTN